MEGMLKEIRSHYFVNFSIPEITDITIATETLLDRYVAVMNKKSQYFKVLYTEMAGSMAEETRIWSFDSASSQHDGKENAKKFPVIEFDFLARLGIGEDLDRKTLESCDGYRNIYKISPYGKSFRFHESKGVFLSPSDVRQRFHRELLNAIESACNCNSVIQLYYGIECIGQKKKNGCPKCKVEMESGSLTIASMAEFGNSFNKRCDLIFKWRSISCSVLPKDIEEPRDDEFSVAEICVLVDFLPSYGLHESEYLLSESGLRSLIPKVCNACERKFCWRISNSREETRLIHETTEHHRGVFMALKVFVLLTFRRSDKTNNPVSSYIIKTAFLHHISNCYDKSVTKLGCFCNILDSLSISFQNRALLNLFTDHNLLEKYMHRQNDFFQEFSTCFEIIKHVVLLADLLGDNNCFINVVYPHLRNANIMYNSLLGKEESLGDLQKYITNIQAERERVADAMFSFQIDVSKRERRSYTLSKEDISDDEYSRPVDSVSINSFNDYGAKVGSIIRAPKRKDMDTDIDIDIVGARRRSGINVRAPEIIDMKGRRRKFEKKTQLKRPSKYRQKSDINQDKRKPPGKIGSLKSKEPVPMLLNLPTSSKQFMGQKNLDYLRDRDRTMNMEGKPFGPGQTDFSMRMTGKPLGQELTKTSAYRETRRAHKPLGPEQTGINTHRQIDMISKPSGKMPAKLKNNMKNVKRNKKPNKDYEETVASYLCNVM